ncbi:MAG: BMP family ABC transporter substrate-binding protein [Bacilli bacterium]|nr:BMP family ABC transporter substrate-binding protein [Bacilli bacterium]
MKKLFNVLVLVLVAVFAVNLTACGGGKDKESFKIGLICLHDESSTYDKNFIDSMYRALEELRLEESQLELVTGIGENEQCYQKASELAQTCDIVFADSFGHEDYMIQAAMENEDVWFCHSTGTKAHTKNLNNYFNAFASIYQGRYLAGIVAGMKLQEMIDNEEITAEEAIMGYVGAFPYAEVVSGYTSFYLGAKSVCPSVTMKVRYTTSWYDYDKEKAAAEALVQTDNCVLISQHADSYGAPEACETLGVPNVAYNGSTASKCPNTYLVASKIDWTPYYVEMIKAKMDGKTVSSKDYTGTLTTGSVKLDALGQNVAAGTQEALDAAIEGLKNGTIHVFDTNNFTVGGQKLSSYLADVDDFGDFEKETEVISGGYFHESEYRSAPYFDIRIDGITEINE